MKYTEELRRRQRAGLLSQISTTDRLIRQIYIRAAARLEKQAEGAKDESLTRRWQEDYSRSVRREIDRMNREIEAAVASGLDRSARIRADGAAEYLERAAGMAGLRLSDSFTDVLSHCRTDALEALIGGRMYTDGRILSQRIWSAAGRLQGGIEEIIAQGIAQQQSTYQIARALEAYVNPKAACPVDWRSLYPDTPFEMKVDYNATRLARTAINHAYWQTGINAAEANPFCKAMHWELSDAHYERQVAHWGEDECDVYARHDEGLGRGNFPIGKLPRPHPNCLCIQYEVLPEPEEAAARFRAWMDGAKDDELEQGFAQFVQKESRSAQFMQNNSSRPMAGGGRRGINHRLTSEEIRQVRQAIADIRADISVFDFDESTPTGYDDEWDRVYVSGNVMPDLTSNHPRDRMSARAVLAHEYYGHRTFRGTKATKNSWNDEFRASYTAALYAPGLTDDERRDLMLDAQERAKEAGVSIRLNAAMRRILYGF